MGAFVTVCTGRPRLCTGLTSAHSSSVNGRTSGSSNAAAVIAMSSSTVGISVPGFSLGVSCHLSRISLSQADDATYIVASYIRFVLLGVMENDYTNSVDDLETSC